jgi:hypothetical protein
MIDIDLTDLKLLPADHIALKDYDYIVGVEKHNKMLQKTIYALITAGLIVLIYKIIKDVSNEKK